VPYVLVDNTTVANNWNALTANGPLLHQINLTEQSGTPPTGTFQCGGNASVWSDTTATGNTKYSTNNCSDWTDNTATAAHSGGWQYKSSPSWTDLCQLTGTGQCAKTAALYCIQQ
jgi:hypothetical protein